MNGREEDGGTPLPPRGRSREAASIKRTRRFYGTLVILFSALIVALIGWYGWVAP